MTAQRPKAPKNPDDPKDFRDIEDRDDFPGYPDEPTPSHSSGKETFVQRIGLTPLLAAIAAIITAIAALVNAFNSRGGHQPDAPPPAAVGFNISDYWSGTPQGTSQPLIFHLLVAEQPILPGAAASTAKRPASVTGTMRNPCQGDAVIRIDSGSWDGTHLTAFVSQTGSGKPFHIDVSRTGDQLEGSVLQGAFDGHITLNRGEATCPSPR
jgi:hypothetical protein